MEETVNKEAPQLAAVLKEMKVGLDAVRCKVQALTSMVKENQYPTADGISYLEAKHLLLVNYCQSLVYYLLRKAKGFSVNGHPVVRSLIETRLFLEKIRPIDKKLQYQIEKLTRVKASATETVGPNEKEEDVTQETQDLLRYRPNPDMLISKVDMAAEVNDGVYRPPKFAPTIMEEEKMSKEERNARRKEKNALLQAKQSPYVREMMNEYDGKPEEVRDFGANESRELTQYVSKMEERARREEELFTRAPLTKMEKKKEKYLKKSNGLLGLTDSFFDEIKTIPMDDEGGDLNIGFPDDSNGRRKFKRRKKKH